MSQFTAVLESARLSKGKRKKPRKQLVGIGAASIKKAEKAMEEARKRSAAVDASRQSLRQIMAPIKAAK